MMINLNLPDYQFNIKRNEKGVLTIYDPLRHRFVRLTPEEWVRQNFVKYLITEKHYPMGLMANEVSLVQNGIKRRCDSLVADAGGRPLVIVEYKAPHIAIDQAVFDQIILRYNQVMMVKYLMVSNGLVHYCCRNDYEHKRIVFLTEIPEYSAL